MNRRTLVKHLVWMGAGVVLVPSCVYRQDKLSIRLNTIQINPEQEKLLSVLANLIIPPTDTPGAADLGAHLFALKMVDDCAMPEQQQPFIAGLQAFQQQAAEQLPGGLAGVAAGEQKKFLDAAFASEKDANLQLFLKEFRRLVTRGYRQSEYVMTKLLPYQLVPGPYKACIPFAERTQKS
jgi:hypothetical protein